MIMSKYTIAVPPGETLKEQIADRGMDKKEFAVRMGVSEAFVNNLFAGTVPLTPNVAEKIETAIGVSAEFWSNLEKIYRENIIKVEQEDAEMQDKRAAFA